MQNESTVKSLLEKIQNEYAYEKLNAFQDPLKWASMTDEERELLAVLFIRRGEHQLESRDNSFYDSFEAASSLLPFSYDIHFQQGKACAAQIRHIHCLTLASQSFAKAISCRPNDFSAWLNWGDVLLHIGAFYHESSYLIEADTKFKMAETILKQQADSLPEAEILFWRWGLCWSLRGRQAGEPQDVRYAIDKYKQAVAFGCNESDFWHDYGSSLLELGMLIQRQEMLVEASGYYLKALERAPDYFEYWFSLACCYQYLYEITLEEDYFDRSHDSFENATKLESNEARLWQKWGQLLSHAGKASRCLERVEASLEKFEKANKCDPDNPIVLSRWGEAELLVGTNVDRLDLIRAAEAKIIKSLEICPESADIWFIYGACLNALGHYFNDEENYNQAIEKFQYGLSLDRNHSILWYGLAMAHYALGDRSDDIDILEKSLREFDRVTELGGGLFPQFWNDWGVVHMKLAEILNTKAHVEAAIEKFERAIKHPSLDSDRSNVDLEWVYNYGCAYDFLGDFTEDEACYERAIYLLSNVVQTDPEYAFARYNLALALAHLADATSDIHLYEKAIEHHLILLDHDNEDEMASYDLGMTYIHLAILVQDKHHPEKNQSLLQQAESRLMQSAGLGNTYAYYSLGCLYSIIGNYDAAMHFIERAQLQGALPPVDELMHDEWLDGIRQTTPFRLFIADLSSQQSQEETK